MSYALEGIFLGSTYALVAIGFVIIYSTIKAFQFAQGALTMLASYIFLLAYTHTHSTPLSVLVLFGSIIAISLALSIVAFEPFIGEHFPSLVTGLGASIILTEIVARYFFNGQAMAYPDSLKIPGTFTFLGTAIQYNQLLVLGVAIVSVLILDRFFAKSRTGMQMRALADTAVGARICGISVKRSVRLAFVVAGISAAVAGLLLGLLLANISTSMGEDLTIKAMAAVLLAGLTSLRGAVIAAFLIGMSQTLATGYISSAYSSAIAYLVILCILLWKPQGLASLRAAS
jgi:branched-chain amino acid transport system permease protein